MQLNDEFLKQIIKFATKNKVNFETIFRHLQEEYLPEEFAEIWRVARLFYFKNNRQPNIGILAQELNNNKSISNKGILEKCNKVVYDIIQLEYDDEVEVDLLKTFEEFIRQNKFAALHQKLADLYNTGKRDLAYRELVEESKKLSEFTLESGGFEMVFTDYQMRALKRVTANSEESSFQIPCGIDPIDADTEGGFFTGETELWLGDSGTGKSKLLVTRAIASARRGYNVLHIQAEGTQQQCMTNYDSNWTGIKYMDIRTNRVEQQKIRNMSILAKKLIDTNKGEIFVKCKERFGSITIQEIRKWAKELLSKGVTIHHIVIDYFELIEDSAKKYGVENEVQRQVDLGRALKDLAVEFNCLVTTATQSMGISHDLVKQEDFVLTRYNLGQSKRKFEAFSYFFTINRTPDEAQEQICRIYADKYRELPSGQIYRIAQNLGNSRFYDRKRTNEIFLEDDDE